MAQEAPGLETKNAPDFPENEPLTLRRCLEIGLERNYDVRIVRNDERISDNNATAANAGMLPTVDLSPDTPGRGTTPARRRSATEATPPKPMSTTRRPVWASP